MHSKFKRKILKFWIKYKPLLLIILLTPFFWRVFFFIKPVLDFSRENGISPTFLWSLLFSKKFPLKKKGTRTNLLLLGIAGGNHQGSDLTDTIIFLSLELRKRKALLVSLPRDIWSPTLRDKINSAFHYGEEKKEGGGLTLAKLIAEEVLGQPVHYAFLLDFSSFKKAIDVLGGINIEVERSFDDFRFPIEGKENDSCNGDPTFSCRYEHISFKKGWQRMNGARALKYARSRNAEGEEGGDFARAARQQKLLLAFKDKVFSYEVLSNPFKIKKLIEIFRKGVRTDLTLADACFLGKFALKLKKENIERMVLREDLFVVPPLASYGKWVLVPSNEDFTSIHQYIDERLRSL